MLLDFEAYRQLYSEAKEYDTLDMYVSERGWQSWMSDDASETVKTLQAIYDISKGGIRCVLAEYGGTQAAFAREFLTPKRTVENWAAGVRTPPERTILAIGYAVINRKSV